MNASRDSVSTRHPAAVLLAEAGWPAFQDRLILGLCHDLNGRVASLQAVTHLVEMGEPLPATLGIEAERLKEVANRLALLHGDLEAPPTPFALDQLLRLAVDTYARLKDVDGSTVDVGVNEGAPPVLVNEGRFMRTLLLFVDWARCSTSGSALTLEVTGDADGVEVGFDAPEEQPDARRPLSALDRVASIEGGRVSLDAGRGILALPSLSRSRAEGR